MFNCKSISDEAINELILDKDAIQSQITNTASALQVLRKYASADAVKKRPSTMEALLRIVLNGIETSQSLSDVIAILSYIQSVAKQHIKFIKQENLWKSLYSDTVLREMISKFAMVISLASHQYLSLLMKTFIPLKSLPSMNLFYGI